MGKKSALLVLISISLCLLAALGGYKGSRLLADEITTEAEINAEKAGLFKPENTESGAAEKLSSGEKVIKSLKPMGLIYVMDYETGKVKELAVGVFDTISMNVSMIYLDIDISYTMTGALYRMLANENVLVPQTVRFSELYSYYGNAAAFGAGRKIVSELLGMDIDYFISLSKDDAPEDLLIGRITALGLKELYEDRAGKETDLKADDEIAFSNLCLYLSDSDVKGYEAPVIRRNESCFADVIGIWEMLKGSGV